MTAEIKLTYAEAVYVRHALEDYIKTLKNARNGYLERTIEKTEDVLASIAKQMREIA